MSPADRIPGEGTESRIYGWKGAALTAAEPVEPRRIVWRRPYVYPKQEAALFCTERYGIVEASTKSGKTVGCMMWILEQAFDQNIGGKGRHFWWVAPTRGVAKIPFDRIRTFLKVWKPDALVDSFDPDEDLPPPVTEDEIATYNRTDLSLTLANGSVVEFKSAEIPDNLYGQDVFAAVIDEASRCREEAFTAVRSTLTATGGSIRVIGNVKGRRNWAYLMARQAEAGEPDMHYAVITALDAMESTLPNGNPVIDPEEVEDARRRLPEAVFNELYMAIASDDEGNPFGLTHIRLCAVPSMSVLEPVCWGWDLGKSIDRTVGIGLDVNGDVCRIEAFQMDWEPTEARIVAVTGGLPAFVDSTGVGDPIVERLYRRYGNYEGFKYNQTSKQQLMEGLAVAIQSHEFHFEGKGPDGLGPESALQAELESFEFIYTRTGVRYGAPDGMHDDYVNALALARMRWKSLPGAWYDFSRDTGGVPGPGAPTVEDEAQFDAFGNPVGRRARESRDAGVDGDVGTWDSRGTGRL